MPQITRGASPIVTIVERETAERPSSSLGSPRVWVLRIFISRAKKICNTRGLLQCFHGTRSFHPYLLSLLALNVYGQWVGDKKQQLISVRQPRSKDRRRWTKSPIPTRLRRCNCCDDTLVTQRCRVTARGTVEIIRPPLDYGEEVVDPSPPRREADASLTQEDTTAPPNLSLASLQHALRPSLPGCLQHAAFTSCVGPWKTGNISVSG